MPLKIFLVLMLLRWLWRHTQTTLWPKWRLWLSTKVMQVRLAWRDLAWPYRILIFIVLIPIVIIIL